MRHQNYSVPSLPTQHHQQEPAPPMPPPYEETDVLGSLNNMRISDPHARGTTPFQPGYDPIPRAGTSMSVRSAMSAQSHPRMLQPAHHQSLPTSPDQAVRRMPPGRPQDPNRQNDVNSVHSARSVGSGGSGSAYHRVYSDYPQESFPYDGSAETDGTSLYSHDDSMYQHPQNGGAYPPHGPGGYPQRNLSLPPDWQGQGQGYGPPPQQNYNSLYAAASDVLGMGRHQVRLVHLQERICSRPLSSTMVATVRPQYPHSLHPTSSALVLTSPALRQCILAHRHRSHAVPQTLLRCMRLPCHRRRRRPNL